MKRILILVIPFLFLVAACNKTPGNTPATQESPAVSTAQENSAKATMPPPDVAVTDMNDDQLIALVKASTLDEIGDKSITIGQALDGYPHFDGPGTWGATTTEQGRKIVYFEGYVNPPPDKKVYALNGYTEVNDCQAMFEIGFVVNLDRTISYAGNHLSYVKGRDTVCEADMNLTGIQHLWAGKMIAFRW